MKCLCLLVVLDSCIKELVQHREVVALGVMVLNVMIYVGVSQQSSC